MCDDLKPVGTAESCDEFPIEISFCKTCLTAHQIYQVPKVQLFPFSYHYRSRFTADVLSGMKELCTEVTSICNDLVGKTVLDIGCNDGSLLNFFNEAGAKTYGIEPTSAALDIDQSKHVVINDYLTPSVASEFISTYGNPRVITFTNVFAHIENLSELIESLSILMDRTHFLLLKSLSGATERRCSLIHSIMNIRVL